MATLIELKQKIMDELYGALNDTGNLDSLVTLFYTIAINQISKNDNLDNFKKYYYAEDESITGDYSLTIPSLLELNNGDLILFKPNRTNSGTINLVINEGSPITIKRDSSTNLSASDIHSGEVVMVIYQTTGTYLRLLLSQTLLGEGGGGGPIEPATENTLGGVLSGGDIIVDELGNVTVTRSGVVPVATTMETGVIKVGEGLNIDIDDALNVENFSGYDLIPATSDILGGIRVGQKLTIDPITGILDAVDQMEGRELVMTPATTQDLGGVIIGDRVDVDIDGTISVEDMTYDLIPATSGTLGGLRVGSRLTVNPTTGVVDADDQSYDHPTNHLTTILEDPQVLPDPTLLGNTPVIFTYDNRIYINYLQSDVIHDQPSLSSIGLIGLDLTKNIGANNTSGGYTSLINNTTGENNTAFGTNSLRMNETGGENVAIGSYALYTNNASFNIALGTHALHYNEDGGQNVAIGSLALEYNTASNNIAIGAVSMQFNTTGENNVATGPWSLYQNISGSRNVCSGFQSLASNQNASDNIGIGYRCLFNNNSDGNVLHGHGNVGFGTNTLYENISGNNNTGLGYENLKNNISGSNNVASGFSASYTNSTGNNNISLGYESAYLNETGNDNISLGYQAAYGSVDSNNIALGYKALYTGGSGNSIGIGYEALKNSVASDSVGIGYRALYNASSGGGTSLGYQAGAGITTGYGNVNIGKNSQQSTDVSFSTTLGESSSTSANNGTSLGYSAQSALQGTAVGDTANAASGSVAFGYSSNASGAASIAVGNDSTSSGTDSIAIGTSASASATNAICIGHSATASGETSVTLGYASSSSGTGTSLGFGSSSSGTNSAAVGANSSASSGEIQLGANGTTPYAYATLQQRSDARMKDNISDIPVGLDFIIKLKPREYKMKNVPAVLDENNNVIRPAITFNRKHFGLIAQEVKETMDELEIDFAGYQDHNINNIRDEYTLGYSEFISPIIKAIQEQQVMIKSLEDRIKVLEGV